MPSPYGDFYNKLVLLLHAENYKYHRNISQKYGLSELKSPNIKTFLYFEESESTALPIFSMCEKVV